MTRITADTDDPARVVEALYVATLSRRPTPAESTFMTNDVKHQGNRKAACAGILWTPRMNSRMHDLCLRAGGATTMRGTRVAPT